MRKRGKAMSELVLKIYENIVRHEDEAIHMEKHISEKAIQLSRPFEKKLSIEEMEELQDIMFEIALTAEHEGFQLGAKYFAKLLAECLS